MARECPGKHQQPNIWASVLNKQADPDQIDRRLAVQMSISAIKQQAAEAENTDATTSADDSQPEAIDIKRKRKSKLMTLQRTCKTTNMQKDGQFWSGYMTYYKESKHDVLFRLLNQLFMIEFVFNLLFLLLIVVPTLLDT